MKNITAKRIFTVLLVLLVCTFGVPSNASDSQIDVQQRIETTPEDIPTFNKPVALLVGLHGSDLQYNEISALSGFELLTVPYRSDINTLVKQVSPSQIIVKHPSGFVGLYGSDGSLVRGVKTIYDVNEANVGATPPSIIQPIEASVPYPELITQGSLTGTVPHGGLGYKAPSKGKSVMRHLLKLGTLVGLAPFQYPGYFNAYSTTNTEKLLPSLLLPQVPLAIGAASTVVDARLDEAEYEYARTQPRDYKFQPIIEGY